VSDQITASKESSQRECEHEGRESVVKLSEQFTEEVAANAEHCGQMMPPLALACSPYRRRSA
jgi:hypothetical protein